MNLKTSLLYLAFTTASLAREIGEEAGVTDQHPSTAPHPNSTSTLDKSKWLGPCWTQKFNLPCPLEAVTAVDPTILGFETQTPGPLPLAAAVPTAGPAIEPRAPGTGTEAGDIQPPDNANVDDWVLSYDCEGSVMCDTMALKWCDEAVNYHLQRQDDALYGVSLPKVGACAGWGGLGCAVFIQGGDSCNRTGNQIWWDYQDIRKVGHCTKCGTKHWYPGCMTTINYVTWCTSDKVDYR